MVATRQCQREDDGLAVQGVELRRRRVLGQFGQQCRTGDNRLAHDRGVTLGQHQVLEPLAERLPVHRPRTECEQQKLLAQVVMSKEEAKVPKGGKNAAKKKG